MSDLDNLELWRRSTFLFISPKGNRGLCHLIGSLFIPKNFIMASRKPLSKNGYCALPPFPAPTSSPSLLFYSGKVEKPLHPFEGAASVELT